MKIELDLLKDGKISFDEFARRTDHEWQRLAARIYRKWRTPKGVEVADIVQELKLSAWKNSTTWIQTNRFPRAGNSMVLEAYVVWMACREAERWVHQQRNAKRRSAHAPGRYDVAWTDFSKGDQLVTEDNYLFENATSETIVIGIEALSDVIECLETEAERLAVYAWLTMGSVEQAAAYLESDAKRRSALNLWTDGAARRLVKQSLATTSALMQDVA